MSDTELIRRIKTTLRQQGLTQRDLAARLGKQETELSRWLSGRVGIGERNLRKIEQALQTPLAPDSLRWQHSRPLRIGVVGTGSIAERFANEADYVEGCRLAAAYNPDLAQCRRFCEHFDIATVAESPSSLLDACDAVYVASPYKTHYDYVRMALEAGRHVLCETPFTHTRRGAADLYALARRKGLQLQVALKTAYCPSFRKLVEIARSGEIGEVADISATVTTMLDPARTTADFNEDRLRENATYPLLAAFKLLGTSPLKVHSFRRETDGRTVFAHVVLEYPGAVASFKVGTGVKSEGSLVVSGTKGYIYVPAPWWKTDYFELRYENASDNRKVYFPYEQAGLRYELQTFVDGVRQASAELPLTREENLRMVEIQEKYL